MRWGVILSVPSAWTAVCAAWIRPRRGWGEPWWEIEPSRMRSPELRTRGVSPAQEARWREGKRVTSPTSAVTKIDADIHHSGSPFRSRVNYLGLAPKED